MGARPLPEALSLEVGLDEPTDEASLRDRVARRLGVSPAELPFIALRSRSVDARRGSVRFHLVVTLRAERTGDLGAPHPRSVDDPGRVVIVGGGPAGLFCAYELARRGVGATIVDRGKTVQPRRRDLKGLNRRGEVNPDSNYCFGEGGAGTYSDGKLYTRSNKRGNVRDVIEILARHGAPEDVLVDARPHIGSNKLPNVVTSIRTELENAGVRFLFESRVVELVADASGRVSGVRLEGGGEVRGERVVLSTGHSARDVYALLDRADAVLEAKAFAVGVRIEHPQPLINEIQYGRAAGHPRLPNASYRLATTADERGVFSFCMCPGGWIVPAATEPGGLVVNGMSLSKRNSPYANSGLVVAVEPRDLAEAGFAGRFGGIALQRTLEEAAWRAGGGALRAPAARVTDFVGGRSSTDLPKSSYIPGLGIADVDAVLHATRLRIAARLRAAIRAFDRQLRGYLTDEAVVVGVETRTSSPLRVVRDAATLQAPGLPGLYPCGEGAGYAGGILSAAMDGMRVARKIHEELDGA